MADFEVIVRPVVFPNIRPQPARSLPLEDDPEQGFTEIRGNPAQLIDLTFSTSISMSKSRGIETERRVDTARVYQQDEDGTVNRDNFVDVDVANRIKKRGGKGPAGDTKNYFGGGKTTGDRTVDYYKKVEEKENIEIRERDIIKKNPDDTESGAAL